MRFSSRPERKGVYKLFVTSFLFNSIVAWYLVLTLTHNALCDKVIQYEIQTSVSLPSTQKFILLYFIKGRVFVFLSMQRAPWIPLLLLHANVKQQHLFRIRSMHRDHSRNIHRLFSPDLKPVHFPADTVSLNVSLCKLRQHSPISLLVTCWGTSLRSHLKNCLLSDSWWCEFTGNEQNWLI